MKPSAIALGTVFNQTVETAGTFSPHPPSLHPHLPAYIHELTPADNPRSSLAATGTDIPAGEGFGYEGGVPAVAGGVVGRCDLEHVARRLRSAVVRRRRPHQRHRHPQL